MFTFAYYLDQTGQSGAAMQLLERFCATCGGDLNARLLLADLLLKSGRTGDAARIYEAAAAGRGLPAEQQRFVESRLRALQGR